ncbi:MAG: hypothetical protein JO246_12705 [Frankiaceae bacterium]|nr:hypothetical protein [Frankiaceae bacterium]MBV9870438.1 hypothetical protein [Frankiaceae bacterium]
MAGKADLIKALVEQGRGTHAVLQRLTLSGLQAMINESATTPVLAFNPDWTDDDRATLETLASQHGVDGSAPSPKGDLIKMTKAGKVVAWVNRNHVDVAPAFGGGKVRLSTARGVK